MGTEIYFTDGTDPEEDSGVLDASESLQDLGGVRDVLDTGWSPTDRPWAVDDWGTTEWEERTGESLAGRLSREVPDGSEDEDGDGLGDTSDTDGELIDGEVGERRAGRLQEGSGGWSDTEPELYASDTGIDSAAASAEEAAVHVVPDREVEDGPGWGDR